MSARKSKMVSFRVSPDEYRRVQQACSDWGVRTVSEFARAAMNRLADQHPAIDPAIDRKLELLRARLESLTEDFETLTLQVRKEPTNGTS